MNQNRVILIIIDGCGIGELPDASLYDDTGSATIPNIANSIGGLNMPCCEKMGLGNITNIIGVNPVENPQGCFGKMASKSKGKDSTVGHWEIGGLITNKAFPLFPNGFPKNIIDKFEKSAGVKIIGNCTANGTEIINKLGKRHLESKELILYTSADSVFQLAAHEDIYPVERLYEICLTAREILTGDFGVSRVIARPFLGEPGSFTRTANRKDFSLSPPYDTILNLMLKNNYETLAIGKIADLFANSGISNLIKTASNDGGMLAIATSIEKDNEHQFIFANLIDFDMLWGHRRDVRGFADALEKFDKQLGEILPLLRDNDILIITADHGCDPTYLKHTDHTREFVPLLVYGKKNKAGVDLGVRKTFADVAKTIACIFQIENNFKGSSFLQEISPEKVIR